MSIKRTITIEIYSTNPYDIEEIRDSSPYDLIENWGCVIGDDTEEDEDEDESALD